MHKREGHVGEFECVLLIQVDKQVKRLTVKGKDVSRRENLFENSDGQVDLLELVRILWRKKFIVGGFFLFSLFLMYLVILFLPKIYKAEALIAPSEEAQGGGVSKMANQLGGLASFANINLGSSAADQKVEMAIEVLKSRDFFYMFARKYSVLPDLLAAENWDMETNSVIYDESLYDSRSAAWVRNVKPPRDQEPSLWEAYEEFKKIFSLSKDKQTGFIKVGIEHVSPYVARRWVDLLIEEINLVMKTKDVVEATKSINFLNDQLVKTSLAEMKTVFYQLVEEQMKTIMLAEVRDEYIFTTIDPAVVAEESVKPKKILLLLLGVFMACALSFFYVLYIYLSK